MKFMKKMHANYASVSASDILHVPLNLFGGISAWKNGGDVIDTDVISNGLDHTIRNITVTASGQADLQNVMSMVKQVDGVRLIHVSDRTSSSGSTIPKVFRT